MSALYLKINSLVIIALIAIFSSNVLPVPVYLFFTICIILLLALSSEGISFKISKSFMLVSLIYIFGMCSLVFYLTYNSVDGNSLVNAIYRSRKHSLEFFIAFFSYLALRRLHFDDIVIFLKLLVLISFLIGLAQLVILRDRVSLLFFEPSSAAYFCLIFLVPSYVVFITFGRGSLYFYGLIITLLMTVSKAALVILITLLFVCLWYVKSISKKILLSIIIGSFGIFFYMYLESLADISDQVRGFILMYTALSDIGIEGLSSEHGVYGTYVTRFSSIIVAISIFVSNPFGVGFGGFAIEYLSSLYSSGLIYVISGDEVNGYILGTHMPSPKSNLLEVFVSLGWVAIPLMCLVYKWQFSSSSINNKLLFFIFMLSSLLIELNNFYLYFAFVIVFSEKTLRYHEYTKQ